MAHYLAGRAWFYNSSLSIDWNFRFYSYRLDSFSVNMPSSPRLHQVVFEDTRRMRWTWIEYIWLHWIKSKLCKQTNGYAQHDGEWNRLNSTLPTRREQQTKMREDTQAWNRISWQSQIHAISRSKAERRKNESRHRRWTFWTKEMGRVMVTWYGREAIIVMWEQWRAKDYIVAYISDVWICGRTNGNLRIDPPNDGNHDWNFEKFYTQHFLKLFTFYLAYPILDFQVPLLSLDEIVFYLLQVFRVI